MKEKIFKCVYCNKATSVRPICLERNCLYSMPSLCDMCYSGSRMEDLRQQHRYQFHTSVDLVD